MKSFFKLLLIAICIFIAFILTLVVPLKIDRYFHLYSNDVTIDTSIYSNRIPSDYLKILRLSNGCCSDSTNGEIYFKQTTEFKHRNSVSNFTYQKRYHFQVYKIDSSYTLSLNKDLLESNTNTDEPIYAVYSLQKENNINYSYKGSVAKPGKIYLDIFGNNISKIIKNDTIACYYAMMRNFSIRFNKDAKPDIYGSTIESMFSKNYQPIEILFFKRRYDLYLLIMSKADKNYQKGTLLNLIKGH
jgi:hypothetical protein